MPILTQIPGLNTENSYNWAANEIYFEFVKKYFWTLCLQRFHYLKRFQFPGKAKKKKEILHEEMFNKL